jgi:hypothetical protein
LNPHVFHALAPPRARHCSRAFLPHMCHLLSSDRRLLRRGGGRSRRVVVSACLSRSMTTSATTGADPRVLPSTAMATDPSSVAGARNAMVSAPFPSPERSTARSPAPSLSRIALQERALSQPTTQSANVLRVPAAQAAQPRRWRRERGGDNGRSHPVFHTYSSRRTRARASVSRRSPSASLLHRWRHVAARRSL